MASEVTSVPVNGNYAPHQGYGGIEQQNTYSFSNNTAVSNPVAPSSASTSAAATATGQPEIPKDEVGWFFVEQYYTTLSRSPEKLYLFYAKRSQLVSGQETDKVQVCVGQRAINDKIKQLDFQDCKVRVTNVDSQSSDSNIVIQVVGEISNKSQPHKKFVQTFVLATQTNGYFVLNDIFRYLVEEEDDFETEAGAQTEETQQAPGASAEFQEPVLPTEEPKTLTSSTDPAAIESHAQRVDKELEEKVLKEQSVAVPAVPSINGNLSASSQRNDAQDATSKLEVPTKLEADRPDTAGSELTPEKPKDPEPSPVATPPPKAAPAQAPIVPKPAVPAAPQTWANRAAAAIKVATPVAPAAPASVNSSTPPSTKPSGPAATPSTTAAPAPSASVAAAVAVPVASSVASVQQAETQGTESQDEWTAVGGAHSRQQSRQVNGAPQEVPQHRGYIKNVFEHIDSNELKSALEKFGELAYFDIARQKNCAFVDFKTAEGYNKATSTQIELGDDKLIVEERRVRPGSTPYVPRGQFQGGRGGRGNAGPGQGGPRGGFQGPRGNFAPRGRGGSGGQRGGRGTAQAA